MKSILLVFALLLGQISISSAIPDPRDSIILESKTVVPGAAAGATSDTSAYTYLKVWITNKDSLTAMSMALQERSVFDVGLAEELQWCGEHANQHPEWQ